MTDPDEYRFINHADAARVDTVRAALRERFDDVIISIDGFTRTDAIMVGVWFLREVVNTAVLEMRDDDPDRAAMYDAAIVTARRMLERDLARPTYRGEPHADDVH